VPCGRPPLRTFQGVTLQPVALAAFKRAQRLSGGKIEVVQSYRSCAQQAEACRNICGDSNGCPGRCASPGLSYHQLGAAIDITQDSLDTAGVIEALEEAGWCQSQPASDPGHFSFDGCH
jgi:LAS superfamily LD-carboxypeptidase LdcB